MKCNVCGGPVVQNAAGEWVCEFCGTRYEMSSQEASSAANTSKQTQQGIAELLAMADASREKGDYDEAYYAYEAVLENRPEEAAAYWGKVLSKFGILYETETAGGKTVKKPTLNRMQKLSILDDSDYLKALQYANADSAKAYQEDAKAIAAIQKRYMELTVKEKPYDVFISFKAQDNNGHSTEDSSIAYAIYERLNSLGNLNVFFSRITLQEKSAGKDYEPIIYSALNSAKVMILVGTSAENVNGMWVKNEWKRFLAQMAADSTKTMIPVVKGMKPNQLPESIPLGNALTYSGEETLAALTEGVLNLTGKGKVVDDDSHAISALREQMKSCCASGDFEGVRNAAEQVLAIDGSFGEAYYYLLLAQYKCKSGTALARVEEDWTTSGNYKYALRYGDEALKSRLAGVAEQHQILLDEKLQESINEAESKRQQHDTEEAYQMAISLINKHEYEQAKEILSSKAYRHPQAQKAMDTCNLAMEALREIGDRYFYYSNQLRKKDPTLYRQYTETAKKLEHAKRPGNDASTYLLAVIGSIAADMVAIISSSIPVRSFLPKTIGMVIGVLIMQFVASVLDNRLIGWASILTGGFALLLNWGSPRTASTNIMLFVCVAMGVGFLCAIQWWRARNYEKKSSAASEYRHQVKTFINQEYEDLKKRYFDELGSEFENEFKPYEKML